MFPTFTGNSRRPRNVNLSGRTSNPFASLQQQNKNPPSHSSSPSGSSQQNAVAHAQQERRARQAEREKAQAARTVQRVWKGYSARKQVADQLRERWDELRLDSESKEDEMDLDESEPNMRQSPEADGGSNDMEVERELERAKLLVKFADRRDGGDVRRVCEFAEWFLGKGGSGLGTSEREWEVVLGKLARWTIATVQELVEKNKRGGPEAQQSADTLARLLVAIGAIFPATIAQISEAYYGAVGKLVVEGSSSEDNEDLYLNLVVTPLSDISSYKGFITRFLTLPELTICLDLDRLVWMIDLDQLSRALNGLMSSKSESKLLKSTSKMNLSWLLAYLIYFRSAQATSSSASRPGVAFTSSVSSLLSLLSDILGQRPNIHTTQPQIEIPKFVRDQVQKLISQDNIQTLLSSSLSSSATGSSEDAAVLASYALTLLQVFPKRGDDIRMWLYMGSMSGPGQTTLEPAIKFFWKAVRSTKIFQEIYLEPKKAIQCLHSSRQVQDNHSGTESDWQKILLFLELYTVVLKVMDDEEFMSGADRSIPGQSWTRQSALPISDVIHLTTFLKHFAFAMYWHSSQILDSDEPVDANRIASYFGQGGAQVRSKETKSEAQKIEDAGFAGISGMTLNYMKGMVTGLLRMLYERDSRRDFIKSKDHWLMKEFNIDGFISAVVEEQAIKSEHQDGDSDEDLLDDDDSEDDQPSLIGTGRTQQVRRLERLKRQQRREHKRNRLQTVTPRLQILQNMPFFIPFSTRVQIFREFVQNDQYIRREGFMDPDLWRIAGRQHDLRRSNASKHMAKVRREHVFDDAYAQFYELGEGLKEPIQITFVDQFDQVEAGIDGGGVTKEFLTSITNEAFTAENSLNLFVENDQHLLHPNPAAIDEKRELMRETSIIIEGSPEWNSEIRDVIKRYEFLGRVVGKCLYEGILVDIHFAPFFLVKWALTGGSGAATNESGYRANINDLRDLDEGLYQGLLKLKNYPGNVEDFSLDFTTTDVISPGPPPKTATRELRPGGSSIPVTNQNRLIYISSVARYRLQVQPALQTSAFLRGLGSIIQPSWLSMFNPTELQTLLGGDASEIDVDDLRANTEYSGVYEVGSDGQEHGTIKDFWAVMKSLGDADRRKVLKYVTSTPRAPLLGFAQLNPRFTIRDSGSEQNRLPSTSTCVNLLKLPIYRDRAVLKDKLLYAVNAGAGFNLS